MPTRTARMIVDPKFRATVLRFKYEAKPIVDRGIRRTILSLQFAAIGEARGQLKELVYDAPLPKSVYSTYGADPEAKPFWTPEQYMAVRRLGKVWKAVIKDPIVGRGMDAYGDVKVSRSSANAEGLYYAWILNAGSDTVGPKRTGHYAARPFWTITKDRMRIRARSVALPQLTGIKEELLGHSYSMLEPSATGFAASENI